MTPISKFFLDDREFFVKRDDLYDPYLSGNKYRKLHSLINTPKESLNTLISYGGTQSNAMLALAALCAQKEWEFIYYTKPLSSRQKEESQGNFADALRLGMRHFEIEEAFYREFISSLRLNLDEKTFLVDQGGALAMAQEGVAVLADEIRQQTSLSKEEINAVATPSGTGTTALFLAQELHEFKVYTTPCVGDASYLKEQMASLAPIPPNLHILESQKKFHFAKPYREFYEIHNRLASSGIIFDMIYAPKMWMMLLEQTDERVLYVHSGGVSGNKTMEHRYAKKFGMAF